MLINCIGIFESERPLSPQESPKLNNLLQILSKMMQINMP
jgi:hypothetical protein